MIDPNQKTRFTDNEMGLLKSLFADGLELLSAIRKAMYQFELTDNEKDIIRKTMNTEVLALLRKVFLPVMEADAPLHQMTDLVIGLGGEIKDLSPDGAWPYIKAKEIEYNYLNEQLNILADLDLKPSIKLEDLKRFDYPKTQREQAWINFTAFNYLVSFIDSHMQQMKFLAGQKKETVEETKARLERDSLK